MNYMQNIPRYNCQLNDVNKILKPDALKYKPGTNYYDLAQDYNIVSTVIKDISSSLYNFIQGTFLRNGNENWKIKKIIRKQTNI